jgi:hypothetical protein
MFSKTAKYLKDRTKNGNFIWRTIGFWSSGFYNMMGFRLFFNLKKLAGVEDDVEDASNPKQIVTGLIQEFKHTKKMFMIFASIAIFIMLLWLLLTIFGQAYFGSYNYYLLVYDLVFSLLAYQQFSYQKKIQKRLQSYQSSK